VPDVPDVDEVLAVVELDPLGLVEEVDAAGLLELLHPVNTRASDPIAAATDVEPVFRAR
jgi:hypothetical protein